MSDYTLLGIGVLALSWGPLLIGFIISEIKRWKANR